MRVSIEVDDKEIGSFLSGLTDENLRQALDDAGQVIINSTKVGYMKRIGPDGNNWPENPAWYAAMKGQSTPLTGPISTKIQGGQWAGGYELLSVNSKRMENSLVKKVEVIAKSVTIEYEEDVQARADLTQYGGEASLMLRRNSGGILGINVKIQPRAHLGIADNYIRLGFKNDVDHIMDAFDALIDRHFQV